MTEVDLLSDAFRDDPYPTYARLREHAPLYRHENLVLVSRFDDIAAVLGDPVRCSSRPMGGVAPYRTADGGLDIAVGSMIGADPPDHGRQRRVVRSIFQRPKIQCFEGLATQIAQELVDALPVSGAFDAVSDFANPLIERVGAAVLGVGDEVIRLLAEASRAAADAADRDQERVKMWTAATLLSEVIADQRGEPGGNLIAMLLEAEADQQLSADEVYSTALLIMVSGVEETPSLMANTLLALYAHPDELTAVLEEPALVGPAVEEGLRFDPPVQMLSRAVLADVRLAGEVLPAGTTLGLLLGSGNRDSRHFDDPDRFWVRRPTQRHLGLGMANHLCIGEALARLVARVGLRTLLGQHVGTCRIAGPLERRRTLVTRGPLRLPLTWDQGLASVRPVR